jgi:hypothetical protein
MQLTGLVEAIDSCEKPDGRIDLSTPSPERIAKHSPH